MSSKYKVLYVPVTLWDALTEGPVHTKPSQHIINILINHLSGAKPAPPAASETKKAPASKPINNKKTLLKIYKYNEESEFEWIEERAGVEIFKTTVEGLVKAATLLGRGEYLPSMLETIIWPEDTELDDMPDSICENTMSLWAIWYDFLEEAQAPHSSRRLQIRPLPKFHIDLIKRKRCF